MLLLLPIYSKGFTITFGVLLSKAVSKCSTLYLTVFSSLQVHSHKILTIQQGKPCYLGILFKPRISKGYPMLCLFYRRKFSESVIECSSVCPLGSLSTINTLKSNVNFPLKALGAQEGIWGSAYFGIHNFFH